MKQVVELTCALCALGLVDRGLEAGPIHSSLSLCDEVYLLNMLDQLVDLCLMYG